MPIYKHLFSHIAHFMGYNRRKWKPLIGWNRLAPCHRVLTLYISNMCLQGFKCVPGFSVTAPWAFNWFLDGNANKVHISIVGTNGKLFLINAHGVLRRMGAVTEIPGISVSPNRRGCGLICSSSPSQGFHFAGWCVGNICVLHQQFILLGRKLNQNFINKWGGWCITYIYSNIIDYNYTLSYKCITTSLAFHNNHDTSWPETSRGDS